MALVSNRLRFAVCRRSVVLGGALPLNMVGGGQSSMVGSVNRRRTGRSGHSIGLVDTVAISARRPSVAKVLESSQTEMTMPYARKRPPVGQTIVCANRAAGPVAPSAEQH